MPKTSLQKLRESIEAAGELTPEHREELRRVSLDLEKELHPILGADETGADSKGLREVIDLSGQLVGRKGQDDSEDLLDKFEEAVEEIAVHHPTVAGILTALGKLV